MEDRQILDLYWAREEQAIRETEQKYGRLCYSAARRVLSSHEDCEECLSDTWLAAWNAIPPARPNYLPGFLGRIARNLALKRYAYLSAAKRNPSAVCSLEELEDCVSGGATPEGMLEDRRIVQAINGYLKTLTRYKRWLFLRRYWYFDSVEEISRESGRSKSAVTTELHRLRQGLRVHLEKEGIEL